MFKYYRMSLNIGDRMKAVVIIEELKGIEEFCCIGCAKTMLFKKRTLHSTPHRRSFIIFHCPKCGKEIGVVVRLEERKGEEETK